MREAENASTAHARSALQKVDATTALVAIGRELRIAEESEFRHHHCGVGAPERRERAGWRSRVPRVTALYPLLFLGSTAPQADGLDWEYGAYVSFPAPPADR